MVHEGYHWDKSTINPQFSYVLISVHIQIPMEIPMEITSFHVTSPGCSASRHLSALASEPPFCAQRGTDGEPPGAAANSVVYPRGING